MRRVLQGLFVSAFAWLCAGEPAHARCADCHPAQTKAHSGTAHARALFRTEEHPLRDRFEGMLRRGKFGYLISQGRLQATSGGGVFEAQMEWAFGAGAQAVTFVSRVSRDWYVEFYPTYYPALRGFGPTPGQHALKPETLQNAVGMLYKTNDPETGIRGCFECHSTGPLRSRPDGALEPSRTGVHCEACHGDSSAHGRSLRGAGGRQINDLCGTCHRKPSSDGRPTDWTYAWNVRHQPIYLNESRCFRQSRGRLTCVTCHDPHQPLSHDSGAYNEKCQSCHANLAGHGGNCVDCHMPRVSPEPPLRFANHWIGVYGGGSKLKPRR